MKNILKLLFGIGLLLGSFQAKAEFNVLDAFNDSNTNTTAATVFIPEGQGVAKLTDVSVQQDVEGTYIAVYPGARTIIVTTGAAAASTNFVCQGMDTNNFATGDYLIFKTATGYQLRNVQAFDATNLYTTASATKSQTNGAKIWWVGGRQERWGGYFVDGQATTNSIARTTEVYFKSGFPVGIVATNASAGTTKAYISGIRIGK